MTPPRVDKSWTLFLDRDGVLNRKIENGYVSSPAMLDILPGVPGALRLLSMLMGRIVTNQRGIARGLMTTSDLDAIHARLRNVIVGAGGRIDGILLRSHERLPHYGCSKPHTGPLPQAMESFAS